MDESAFRLWSVVGVWVTPALTALIAAISVLLATRWEASRAEKRARDEVRRDSDLAAVRATFKGHVDMLLEAANSVATPETGIGRVALLQNAALLGDPALAADWVSVMARLNAMKVDYVSLDAGMRDRVGDLQVRLQQAHAQQVARVVNGERPKLLAVEEIRDSLPENDPGRAWVQ